MILHTKYIISNYINNKTTGVEAENSENNIQDFNFINISHHTRSLVIIKFDGPEWKVKNYKK